MRQKWDLTYNGQTLTTWEVPESTEFEFGQLLAVPYNGRLRPFRLIGTTVSEILLHPEFTVS